jgi:hypothetical protein
MFARINMNVSECWYFNSEQLCHGCLFTALSRVWVIDKLSTFIVDCSAYTSPALAISLKFLRKELFNSRSEWPAVRCVTYTLFMAM